MRWAALLGLWGCNQIYGLDKTRLPPPDGPYACPELGAAAPTFSRTIYQAFTQPSSSYHFNPTGTLAVASAFDAIYTGRFGEPLTLRPEIVAPSGYFFFDPHPSADGERLYIQSRFEPLVGALGAGIAVYEQSSGTWRYVEDLPAIVSSKGSPSTVFNGPAGDRIIFTNVSTLEEYEHIGGQWILQGAVHDRAAIQIDSFVQMAVTSDGLRAVYRGGENTRMMYTDRPNLGAWFRTPEPLAGVPKVLDAQLTDDCARIYYSGLGSVFYSQIQ
jgi:hypothetical protein